METTLDRIRVGRKATIVLAGVSGETPTVTTQRLLHQGIVTGAVVDVIRRTTGGGRILAVGQSRIALDPQVLRGIVVAEGVPGHFPEHGAPLSHPGVRVVASEAPRSDQRAKLPGDRDSLACSDELVALDRQSITSRKSSNVHPPHDQHHCGDVE